MLRYNVKEGKSGLPSRQSFLFPKEEALLFEFYRFDKFGDITDRHTIVEGRYDTSLLFLLINKDAVTPEDSFSFFLNLPYTVCTSITINIFLTLCNQLRRNVIETFEYSFFPIPINFFCILIR